jgi:hypothetical protein
LSSFLASAADSEAAAVAWLQHNSISKDATALLDIMTPNLYHQVYSQPEHGGVAGVVAMPAFADRNPSS